MKKILFLIGSISLGALSGQAQYYYKDIISNKQLLADMEAYKTNKVKSINIKSFEDDGSESEGFFCQKKFSKDYKKASLFTRSQISGSSLQNATFNDIGKLVQTYDSSDIAVTINRYSYDYMDRIQSIVSTIRSQDDDFTTEVREEHIWQYNETGQAEKMTRVKNFKDSTVILFALDENDNVGIEKDTKTGTKYYYYYDAKRRITDIVQQNDFKKGLVPEYVFQYNNSNGTLSQMTTTEEGGNYYYVWKYMYDNGLRIREKCYNKERRLMGSIEYEYKM
ncbi:MAG: hypothetical protein EOO03_03935 [Chitinophagaceae bacterium]|nr:MAG: hypothetical protein EOO03_03935 [Chitinophagaceae bacterium]